MREPQGDTRPRWRRNACGRGSSPPRSFVGIFDTPLQKRAMSGTDFIQVIDSKEKKHHLFLGAQIAFHRRNALATKKGDAMKTKISQLAAAALLTAATASVAHAGFVGRTLQASYYYPDLATPYVSATATPATFTVGSATAVETTINVENVTQIAVDFTDTSLRVGFTTTLLNPTWNPTSFNGLVFDLLTGSAFSLTSASIDPSSTFGGFNASRVGFNDSRLTLDWGGLSYVNGTALLINFTSAPASVPEPGSLALLAMALAVSAYVARQKYTKAGAGARLSSAAS